MNGHHPSRVAAFSLLSILSVVLLGTSALAQDHLVVDDDPGPDVDYASVQAALAAIADGGTIEVRAGDYEEFLNIVARTVAILAEPGVVVHGEIDVHDLRTEHMVTLRGIDLRSLGPVSEPLRAWNNRGPLWVQGCRLQGSSVSFHTSPDVVILNDCASVVLDRCTIRGGTSVTPGAGGRAVLSVRTELVVVSGALTGGRGTGGDPGAEGGPAVEVVDGHLFAFGALFRGGPGGYGQGAFGTCGQGGDGGPALRLSGTNPSGHLIGCRVRGGDAGEALGTGTCAAGGPGAPTDVLAGSLRIVSLPGLLR